MEVRLAVSAARLHRIRARTFLPQYPIISKYLKCASFASYAVLRPHHPRTEQYGVPSLDQSLEKYLAYAKPLVTPEEWENTRNIVSQYLSSNHVAKLQEQLVQRAKMEANWLFDWWLSTYLSARDPVVINCSPAMKMKTAVFRTDQEWLAYATAVVLGVLRFKAQLEGNSLDTEYFSDGCAMCMEQYYAVLGNCRIPGSPHDRLRARLGGPFTTRSVNHICVMYRNRIYEMEFSDAVTRETIGAALVYRQLEHIVSNGQDQPPASPVGLFTTLPRGDWNCLHSVIRQNLGNANTLTKIESCLFVLCLDESAGIPSQDTSERAQSDQSDLLDDRETVSAHNLLHGNLINSGNRWFDKSIQFIVTRDGCVGLNFEHTAADAGVMVPIISHVYETLKNPISAGDTRLPVFAHPKELPWLLPKTIFHEFDSTKDKLKGLIDSLELQYGEFRKFGSSVIKNVRASPDAFFQMALQLAYAQLHPNLPPPPTYETGSLRRFHLGRTDTIRSCSQESAQFTKGMLDPNCPVEDRVRLLRAALRRHQDYTKETLAGQAFDRHLLGLRMLAQNLTGSDDGNLQELRSLFTDPTYSKMNHYRLSTSQICSLKLVICFVTNRGDIISAWFDRVTWPVRAAQLRRLQVYDKP
ncbi:hypothetical protein CRM22_011002 [Opisthorchis felineus]|uniref:Choline/carnitine acyltransferase domain-containing protein n=1 Tax=Opisthorchis felineus TaxID=147828 RepID=A0A4S2KF17_OPIFE|nr:hypothetical protein CRM22_011002 [Opisthorchis felineus]